MKKKHKNYREFIRETSVDNIVEEIETEIRKRNNGKRPAYSDLIKEEDGKTYEYVNYVQEGGGMLGVGLVGYTYVLEKLGFRFLKLAGTSAGAINTIMLAAVDKQNYPNDKFENQSEIILHEMLTYDLWNLVDGHWFAKWLISVFINKPFGKKLLIWLVICSIAIPMLFALYVVMTPLFLNENILFSTGFHIVNTVFQTLATIAVIQLVVIVALYLYFRYRFSKASYGINPGNNFHNWITTILRKNKINNSADLNEAMSNRCRDLSLRPERLAENIPGDNTSIASPFLTIVASDITNQTKVEFPLMAGDYWVDCDAINPADYVRASMSIPIFFEPFKVDVVQMVQDKSRLQQLKLASAQKAKNEIKPTSFVDGGILSNFPINVFHNPNIKVARMPTFGVKLEDEKHIEPGKEVKEKPALLKFVGQVFSTIRFYYDRDFLKRNEIYEKCIAHVDVAGFNWLNFGMDYKSKKELFIRGAEAARTFFLGGEIWVDGVKKDFEPYNWETFKENRTQMVEEIKKGQPVIKA